METFAFLAIAGGVALFVWGFIKYRTDSFNTNGLQRADSFVAAFGKTPAERHVAIQAYFSSKEGTLNFTEEDRRKDKRISFSIARHLAHMSPQELSAGRIAATLYNAKRISAETFNNILLGVTWGNGKASIHECAILGDRHWRPTGIQEAITAYLEHIRYTTDGAINLALASLQAAPKDDPAIKALQRELTGGGNAWLQPEEIGASPFTLVGDNGVGLRLGKLPETGEVVQYVGGNSLITIAPPGAGKTQCQVLPNLALWRGAAIVLDVKGDLFPASQRQRSEFGPVYRFAPLDPENSHCFNPLVFVRGDALHVWEDAGFLASMLIVQGKSSDPFWDRRAHGLLTAIIADACYQIPTKARTMNHLHAVANRIGWSEFVARLDATTEVHSMREEGSSLKDIETKMLDSILQTLKTALAPWAGERVRRATRQSDWLPEDLRGDAKPTIYICLKTGEIDTFASVLRVFVGMHIRRLIGGELPRHGTAPILILLDEMPRMQYMPPIEEALEVGRQFGLQLWMFAQNEGQIEKHYVNAKGLIGACAIRMFMNPSLHDGTAGKLSGQLGDRESPLDGRKELLVPAPELAGPAYKDDILVFANGCKPLRLRKSFAHSDPEVSTYLDLGNT